MTNSMEKTIKYLAIVVLALAGAVFFYAAGLGTGLYIARTPQLALAPTHTPPPIPTLTPTPTLPPPTPPSDQATPIPTPTRQPPTVAAPTPTMVPSIDRDGANFNIFWETWDILQDEFYGDLPPESELPYAAIRGVIASTGDPYTAFLDPVQANIVRTDMSGSFEGIGATVRLRPDGKFEIVQPLAGYPAIKAGVRSQDIILEVDGQSIKGMTIYETISLIRGPAGTTVNLLIARKGVDEPFIIAIERARIELPVIETNTFSAGDDKSSIAYIRLTEFGQTATDKLKEALREALAQGAAGLILDLRDNPGGYLSVAVEVASQFIGDGPILIERFQDGREQTYDAIPGGLALDIPLVVLVNGGSASASEIVAGAIQDTERGILIGDTTLGKGSVQLIHTLSDESQLRVTIAHWFTPNDRAIHGQGLQPDIEVEIGEKDLADERDPQLERAIEYLSNKGN